VGVVNTEGVLAVSEALLRRVKERAKGRSLLIFSCVGRYFALGFNPNAEMEKIQEILGDIPFHLCYSGPELCPVDGKDGETTNRSHNDTIVICML
jgi:small ligand-binding sensory domain FIST